MCRPQCLSPVLPCGFASVDSPKGMQMMGRRKVFAGGGSWADSSRISVLFL